MQALGFRCVSYRCINAHKETASHYIITAVDSPDVQSRAKMFMGLVNRYASFEFKPRDNNVFPSTLSWLNIENHQYTTMASSSPPTSTTFIQADANTFRDLVQKLTGFTRDTDKLPGNLSSKPSVPFPGGDSKTPRRPPFKLQERRQQQQRQHPMRKLEIELGLGSNSSTSQCCSLGQVHLLDTPSPVTPQSPLLPYESLFYSCSGTVSPSSPVVLVSEEEKAITEKGFYLHPSPLNTPGARGTQPPELLTLFPLTSPCRDKRE
ncbi:hypothetical protein GQ457_10G003020 [Hibiscus cannabinus]